MIGFVVGGLDVGEEPTARLNVVKSVIEKLPEEKPRVVIGPGAPGMKIKKEEKERKRRKIKRRKEK